MSLFNWSVWVVILVSLTRALKSDKFDGPGVSGSSRTLEITGPLLVNFIFPVLIRVFSVPDFSNFSPSWSADLVLSPTYSEPVLSLFWAGLGLVQPV